MNRKLLPGLLVALFAASPALAFDPFVVKDIRVEGIQRTEAGTVFNYLPVRVGETFTEAQAADEVYLVVCGLPVEIKSRALFPIGGKQ